MLSNQIYIGNTVQGMVENISYKSNKKRRKNISDWDVVEGTHEAIISKDIWDTVQRIRAEKPKQSGLGTPNIFSGKLRCLKCGSSMRTYYNNHSRYFACHTAFFAKERCPGTYVSTKVLEREVIKQIQKLYESLIDNQEVSDQLDINKGYQEKIKWLQTRIEADKGEIGKLRLRFKHFYNDKVDGLITVDDFNSLNAECRNRISELEKKIQSKLDEIQRIQKRIDDDEDRTEIIREFKNITELDRITVQTLIDYIEIGGSRNNRIINIHWNF
jgi:hypothetical protein